MTGPAGTGKTAMAEAVAKEAGINCVILNPARIFGKYVGDTERNLDRALYAILAMAPVLVFIDEIDQSVSRGASGDSGVSNRFFKRLMEFMSDTSHRGKVVFLAASNRPDLMDPALRRPGRFDKLVFTAGVTVTDHDGDYRIEGALVDSGGNLVAWSVSDPQSLSVGNRELTLSFDGRVIHDHLPFSPVTQTLKLMAVKIYSGNLSPATVEDQVPVAMTTEAYTRDQFDAKSVGLFEDNMERGAITNNNWTKQTPPWSLSSAIWHSASNAWQGSGTNGWLTSADGEKAGRYTTRISLCAGQSQKSSTSWIASPQAHLRSR
jgi:hypothetical protein